MLMGAGGLVELVELVEGAGRYGRTKE